MSSAPSLVAAPRAFLSYSWTTPTHESWVVALAERLMQDGVDVVLDKWDLKPGHDANVFMEQMVTDLTVTKVLMICDKVYVEKADRRAGGVGTESQIISPQLYENSSAQQTKFAAVCVELDEAGKPYVPVFYKGRIHFDFTAPERQEAAYEELLRWLADKPRYLKPKLGNLPASIDNPELASTNTASRARRAEEALRSSLPHAQGAVIDYLDAFVGELPSFRLEVGPDAIRDDVIVAQIEAMRPYATEFQGVMSNLLRYRPQPDLFELVLDALESIGGFMFRPDGVSSWNSNDFDAYIVFAHDVFLTTFARVLKLQLFDLAKRQVERRYVIRNSEPTGERASNSFEIFCTNADSLDYRNQRLNLRRASLRADLIHGWYDGRELGMPAVLQADIVLWLISRLRHDPQSYRLWYPWTIEYAGWGSAQEIFARAESKAYYDRIAPLFGNPTAAEFQNAVTELDKSSNALRAGFRPLRATSLTNAANLSALP